MTTPRPSGASTSRSAETARWAVALVFVLHGVLFASWAAHVPQVKAALHLTDDQLGLALLGAPVGSIGAMLFTGAALRHAGSRTVVRWSAFGYSLAGVLVGLARSLPELFVALALWGAFQGALDVSMNTQAVTVEKTLARAVMSRLHGGWSLGALIGAGIGVLGVAAGLTLTVQLLILAVPSIVVTLWAARRLLDDPPGLPRHGRRARPTPLLLLFGAIAFAGLICEGAAADWAAVYLRDALHVAPFLAGLAYAAYALAMLGVRFAGTRLMDALGPRLLIASLAVVASLGMAAGLASGNPWVAILGFATLGAGLGSIIPTLFSAAGNQEGLAPGPAVATVAVIGWGGFLCGPPLIGFLAGRLSLTLALGLLPLLTGLIALIAWNAAALDRAQVSKVP